MDETVPDLRRYDAVLIDLDGTFYREEPVGARVLPGAVELVRMLDARQQKYACLTNAGASPRQLSKRLTGMGVDIHPDHIWSCAAACAEYVLHRFGTNASVFNMATEGMDELLSGKVRWTEHDQDRCDVVLAAGPVNRGASPERQWMALQLLRRGAALVGLCADRVYPSHRGFEFGSGAMTAMLAYAADTKPTFCGKPEEVFFRELCTRLGVAPERCILLGDNLDSDIAGARRVGMSSALMLTGITSRAEAARAGHERRPDFVVESMTNLIR